MRDLREHARARVELEVEYRQLNRFFADYTRDLSKGGAFLHTRSPLPTGTRLSLRLSLPSWSAPIDLEAEVVRTAGEEEPPGMGVRFLWQGAEERQVFHAFVERLMAESLGPALAERMLHGARDGTAEG